MRKAAFFCDHVSNVNRVYSKGRKQCVAELTDLYPTALLDVTFPEPPPAKSELYRLPNIHLTSHIAGSLGDEVVRMADYCIEEFRNWQASKPLRYSVSLMMLETMA